MNKEHILFHLKESEEAVRNLIADLERDPAYDIGNYRVDLSHIYHHINTAWNGRDTSAQEVDECSDDNFNKWRQFPEDLDML